HIQLTQAAAWDSLKQGRYAEAVKSWEELLRLDPDNAQAREGIRQAQQAAEQAKFRNREDQVQALSEKAMDAYDRAITHYNALAAQNPDSPAEYNSLRYLSNCYLDQKRWKEAVEILGKITDKYGRPEYMNIRTLDTILKTINTVSVYQLKDYELPRQIYQDIITKDPNHPWKDYFQKMIDTLSTLKAKSVQVSPAQ
ncbi:MAG: tetratricopeptide repeat protein, partial [Candidatus Omnitrophica bacterium]|nr:tetratricopeptide repeat protein [Candidatus Omnitrophota bacterium]